MFAKYRGIYFLLFYSCFTCMLGWSCKSADTDDSALQLYIFEYKDKNTTKHNPYKTFMEALKTEFGEANISIKPINTSGSLHTLTKMESEKNCIGIVQSDVIYHYFNGQHHAFPFPRKDSRIRAIARIFDESIVLSGVDKSPNCKTDNEQIKLTDKNIKEYKKDSIAEGRTGSGSYFTARSINEILKLKLEFHEEKCLPTIIVRHMGNKENSDFAQYIFSESQAYVLQSIMPDIYFAEPKDSNFAGNDTCGACYSVKQDALLVCTEDVPDKVVEKIVTLLSDKNSPLYDNQTIKLPDYCQNFDYDKVKELQNKGKRSMFFHLPIPSHRFIANEKYGKGFDNFYKFFGALLFIIFIIGIIRLYLIDYIFEITYWAKIKRNSVLLEKAWQKLTVTLTLSIILLYVVFIAFGYSLYTAELHFRNVTFVYDANYSFFNEYSFLNPLWLIMNIMGFETYEFRSHYATSLLVVLKILYVFVTIYWGIIVPNKINSLRNSRFNRTIWGWNNTARKLYRELLAQGKKGIRIIGEEKRILPFLSNVWHKETLTSLTEPHKYKRVRFDRAETIVIIPDKKLAELEHYDDVNLWVFHKLLEVYKIVHQFDSLPFYKFSINLINYIKLILNYINNILWDILYGTFLCISSGLKNKSGHKNFKEHIRNRKRFYRHLRKNTRKKHCYIFGIFNENSNNDIEFYTKILDKRKKLLKNSRSKITIDLFSEDFADSDNFFSFVNQPELTVFYHDMLSTDTEDNELYIIPSSELKKKYKGEYTVAEARELPGLKNLIAYKYPDETPVVLYDSHELIDFSEVELLFVIKKNINAL